MFVKRPWATLKAAFVPDWAKYTMILLYMRTSEGTLRMKLGRGIRTLFRRGLTTGTGSGPQAKAWVPEATELARRVEKKLDGYTESLATETLLGIPTTAHILGGCCMGAIAGDRRHRRPPPRLRLRGPLRHRRLGHLGEPGRESLAHDHGARRAGDEPRPGRGCGEPSTRAA